MTEQNCVYQVNTLQNLDLDQIGDKMKNIARTIVDIMSELSHRFKDLRTPFQPPNAKEIFDLFTTGMGQKFFVGQLTTVTITRFQYRKPHEKTYPERRHSFWKCPFCLKVVIINSIL